MENDVARILITTEEIERRVKELGAQISQDYKGKNPFLVCILRGAVIFLADLIREINIPLTFDFMAVSSYGDSTSSSGVVKIVKDLGENIEGRHVLIIEDIIDSGLTLHYIKKILLARNPASLKVCTFLNKSRSRTVDVQVDYLGFTIPPEFVVGYGLDYAGSYRNLSYVAVLKPEIYERQKNL